MRIDSLWIDNPKKNFYNFQIDFEEHYLVNIILGRNGTGKSNVIETIANIFIALEKAKVSADFYDELDFDFEIIYFVVIDGNKNWLKITKKEAVKSILNGSTKEELGTNEKLSFAALKRMGEAFYLPKYLIAYYSGENKRLKQVFKDPEDVYYKLVEQNRDQELDFRRFFYADPHHCQLLLVALLSFAGASTNVSSLLSKYLDIDEFVDFTITLKTPKWNRGESIKEDLSNFWGAKGTPLRFCNYLLTESEDKPIIDLNSKLEIDNPIKESVTILIRGEKFSKGAVDYFVTGIDLFRHLESTYISGLIEDIVIRVKKAKTGAFVRFNELSEGEQQLITIIGLLIFTANDNTLFLLDEPDTHLNPNWQRDYLKLFTDYASKENNHILVSTHSPLLVQAAKDTGLILFKLEDGKPVSNSDIHFIKNWRIDQVLTSEYFELKSARPPQMDEFMEIRESLLNKPILEKSDLEKIKKWESQSGLFPSGETLNDFQAMHLVRTIANEIKANDKN